jgi:glycerol-3-phosphate dehydrogenase (NAD(P)+)
MDQAALHGRARTRGVNPLVYWIVRVSFQAFFWTYLRMRRTGREHIPASGPAIIAANHRSFLDPFVLGTMARRPMYYVAKRELFNYHPVLSWLLSALGAFPVDRGAGDTETIRTAKELLARGEIVLIFPEGHRIRPGGLGHPHRGIGRLALETGAPVVPIAVIGTDAIRRGWRIRPRQVRVRAGAPMRFPLMPEASPQVAGTATQRVWQRVTLQWEWLGGFVDRDEAPAEVVSHMSRAA